MKKLLAACLLAATVAAPAMAAGLPSHRLLDLTTTEGKSQAIGQPVYDLQNNKVGHVDGFIEANGTPVVIIAADAGFGGHKVMTASQDLTPRADGGMLLALSDSSVAQLTPYVPGQPVHLF
jgi:hypothetical protein